ncbi:hypothetical protein JL721_1924 [Aureococcus anophagefferens]|nr:hypothetical protein JL721_1924 [Aureococcus anophagefferens]
MGTESTCVADVECELLWVYRGDSGACATLTAVFTDPDGNVILTESQDNDGQETHIVPGDATVSFTPADGRAVEQAQRDAAALPSAAPPSSPSSTPSAAPSASPSAAPSSSPSSAPSSSPSSAPSGAPTAARGRVVHGRADGGADDGGADDGRADDGRADDGRADDGGADERRTDERRAERRAVARRRRPVDRAEPAVYLAPNDCFGVSIVEANTEANCGTFFAPDQPASDVETVREADAATDARTVSTAGEPHQSAGSGADGDTDDCKPELYAHGVGDDGRPLPCAEVLDFDGADRATCYWIDASLDAASAYALAVTAEDAAAGTNVTSTVDLAVGRAAVVAIVLGGDRVLPLAGAVELDASESYDEDVDGAYGADAGLAFAWSCDDPACDALVRGAADGASVVLDGVDLGEGTSSPSTSRPPTAGPRRRPWSTSSSTTTRRPSRSTPGRRPSARARRAKKIVLYGDAQPSSLGRAVSTSRTFNTTWVLERGTLADEAPLAVWARTAPALSGYARDREHDLVLAVGAIVAGAHYSLRLDATLEGIDTAGSASVDVLRRAAAAERQALASPAAGFALETTFELSTRSWVTEDPPLTYAFKSRTNGSESTLRGPTLEAKLGGVVLPKGRRT